MTKPDLQPKLSSARMPREGYHHGYLRQALIDAAVTLIETNGLDQLSVREVSKAVGVSSAAPFRHFASRTALLTAVAEQAMDRLSAEIQLALAEVADSNPLIRFRAIGVAFFRWAMTNPVHFQVISTRAVIDFDGSPLRARNDLIREEMARLMSAASADGLLRGGDPERLAVAGRALAYGVARMYVDGQFPSWGLEESDPIAEAVALLDQFIASIAAGSTGPR